MSNTDAKILAMTLLPPLGRVAGKTVLESQTGFVKGRSMLDNIVDLESAIIAHTAAPRAETSRPG
eukprot:3173044-Alexandrium_andersonii.AAC.1